MSLAPAVECYLTTIPTVPGSKMQNKTLRLEVYISGEIYFRPKWQASTAETVANKTSVGDNDIQQTYFNNT
jgi:hypothetical protein